MTLEFLHSSSHRIGLGLAALGRPGYINLGHADDLDGNYDVDAMQQHAHTVLSKAWDLGIRYFDAARSYGKAETFLSSWLQTNNISMDDVSIGSKWGYTYTADWQVKAEKHEVKEHSLDVLQRQWQETQENLSQHLDLYQIHSATLESGVLENKAVLNHLAQLKDSGTAIGLSVSGPQQADVIDRAVSVEIEGVHLFDSVQATWNILEQSASTSLRNVHDAGMKVIIKEALANGRISPRNANNPQFSEPYMLIEIIAEKHFTTVDAVALSFVLAEPWVDMVLSGAATAAHLEANMKALKVNLSETDRAYLSTLIEKPQDYWQTRSNLAWN